ncbi:hypothetical protein [Vibrio toranzoniae]|uniref:Uncharacterized protein n=1 Tax=Vibrio toranzoniae TaxID=1194427 RepID=A0A120DGP0_9VIBR|nr:hypothetical protein [Vibrio toranzoniae]KWU01188.1 hypothetical protein APQ14_07795 [Vibrio toranzoniae]NAZ97206.1 hypothetical protein [Vibrio toranzoniae]SBS34235.1 hypothetical protein VTO7225_01998 [Vibrio toranzoniae]
MLKTLITWIRKWITKATPHPKEPAIQPIKTNIETLHAQAPKTLSEEYLDEKDKVRHRLERWALHQDQINSRILNAYLTLERKGYSPITITMLQNQLLDMKTFLPNFNQMKSIAPHNHAKVFDVRGEIVRIWSVVEVHVREYENKIFH